MKKCGGCIIKVVAFPKLFIFLLRINGGYCVITYGLRLLTYYICVNRYNEYIPIEHHTYFAAPWNFADSLDAEYYNNLRKKYLCCMIAMCIVHLSTYFGCWATFNFVMSWEKKISPVINVCSLPVDWSPFYFSTIS